MTADLSASQEQDLDDLTDAMHEPARRRLLLAICTAPASGEPGRTGGRACPTMLCQLTGMDLKRVSRHLASLKLRGLVVTRQEAQYVWYSPAPNRVRYETHGDRYALTLFTPSGYKVIFDGPVGAAAVPRAEAASVQTPTADRVAAPDSSD